MVLLEVVFLALVGFSLNNISTVGDIAIGMGILTVFFVSIPYFSTDEGGNSKRANLFIIGILAFSSFLMYPNVDFLVLINVILCGQLLAIQLLENSGSKRTVIKCFLIVLFFLYNQLEITRFHRLGESNLFVSVCIVPLLYYSFSMIKRRSCEINSFGILNSILALSISSIAYFDYIGLFSLRSDLLGFLNAIIVVLVVFISFHKYLFKRASQLLTLVNLLFAFSILALYSKIFYLYPKHYLLCILFFMSIQQYVSSDKIGKFFTRSFQAFCFLVICWTFVAANSPISMNFAFLGALLSVIIIRPLIDLESYPSNPKTRVYALVKLLSVSGYFVLVYRGLI